MLKQKIQDIVSAALVAAQNAGDLPVFELPKIEIMRPKQASHGDYSCNVALVAAAAIRKATGEKSNPRQIAQAVVDHLPLGTGGADASSLIGQVELAGPGFINIHLADGWLQRQVAAILEAGSAYGDIDLGHGARWQVEYVSANPTGPIHYGGARNAVLGDVLANVLEASGYVVQREYYVNDGGTQFAHFAESLYARYAQVLGQDIPVPEDGYPGEYMLDYARKVVAQHGDRFLQMTRPEAVGELRDIGRSIVLAELKAELAGIGVTFDRWFSEQSLHDDGSVEQALNLLEARGQLARRDGALWFLASNYPKNEKDEVVIRSTGAPTYFASDIAYHYDKFVHRNFDRVVNVWAVDHQGHVPRMAAIMQALDLDPERLTILMYDLVRLVRDGKEVRLSKRAGQLLTIKDVASEVGADALRFNLLSRSPESTIDFDLDLAVSQSNDNPVYYVQYGHARICSILARAAAEGLTPPDLQDRAVGERLSTLAHPAELALIRKMIELEEQVELAVERLTPHNLTFYAIDLTKSFSAFYRDCKVVLPEEPALSQARLLLCLATQVVLAKVLTLLGVNAPVSM